MVETNILYKCYSSENSNMEQFNSSDATFFGTPLESIFRTSKKTIQEYVREIDRYCRYKSVQSQVTRGVVLDDRGPLIDLYDACVQQDAHLSSVLETIKSQIIGERYMLCRQNASGKYIKDVEATKKIQGSQFTKIIEGIVEAKWYGYTLLEIMPDINPMTGKLSEVNIIERRNVLPNQRRVVQRQGEWSPGWDLDAPQYKRNYVLVNTGNLGLFSATTPLILAKKFTLANYVNFSHTYGQPIIHGKAESESNADRKRLAQDIANAAQNKIIVTGLNDTLDVKTFTMSNSEQIYSSLMNHVNKEVSNLLVGSETVAGATQAYVGSTSAHQDVFRERVDMYRGFVEDVINEEVAPRLAEFGYIEAGLIFKYASRAEMSNKDKISLYSFITDKYEVPADEIEKEFGISVGKQFNVTSNITGGDSVSKGKNHDRLIMSDEEYYKRYGHARGKNKEDIQSAVNFLTEEE